ncbi:hypothetical protein ASPVEDRAFT_46756 [Aspergillus versicolor CBS 583.65]|uniref:Uncharacterized protein n=1 Tax=Aspergillus versicolor CBS 583.65 TaxID=1036611 RepID=A0A1L9Q118_ASPVE|nr:uncharacterized protein ASPVEDRAFT_46756 [Aspergillus versicolor CBS 583.65]OJJ07451.1 hypothetical protein ASPVEDRAFT_46756 [Aspergillus versicolor CBS 583.65]
MAPSIAYPAPSASLSPSPLHTLSKKPQINIDIVELTENTDSVSDSTAVQPVDPLDSERARLRAHLGLDSPAPQIQPLFFIEQAPNTTSNLPVQCSLPGCTAGIEPNSLRLALNPGMSGDIWFRSSSDYYHIPCFERLADFTQSCYLDRIVPLTRNTFKLRGLKISSVSDGSYLLTGGAERLILEWKITRGMEIDKRDGVYDEAFYRLDPDVNDLLYKAGSSGFWPTGRPGGLDVFEYYTLARTVAVNECSREEEWNLFEQFLGQNKREGVWGRHDLSAMLGKWQEAVNLALQESKHGQDMDGLSATAVKAIRRLSTVPTPQIGLNCI